MTLYHLARALAKEKNELLWLAITGLTDLFLHSQLSQESYTRLAQALQNEVSRLNVPECVDSGSIQNENDFRFLLLRHWNLYDAMFYSNYIASKFGIWWESGKKKLLRYVF